MSVLEQRQNSKRTLCHDYDWKHPDKDDPTKTITTHMFGCDQEIKWKKEAGGNKKYNMDGTLHKCTHSNAHKGETPDQTVIRNEVEANVAKLAQDNPPAVFKPASDFSPQDEFIISIGRLNTNVEKLLELHMQTNELLKQVIKVKEAK